MACTSSSTMAFLLLLSALVSLSGASEPPRPRAFLSSNTETLASSNEPEPPSAQAQVLHALPYSNPPKRSSNEPEPPDASAAFSSLLPSSNPPKRSSNEPEPPDASVAFSSLLPYSNPPKRSSNEPEPPDASVAFSTDELTQSTEQDFAVAPVPQPRIPVPSHSCGAEAACTPSANPRKIKF